MKTYQQNQLAMYQTVLRFFGEAGAPLLAVKRIEAGRAKLADVVARIGAAGEAQDLDTTEITQDRTVVKAHAAPAGGDADG